MTNNIINVLHARFHLESSTLNFGTKDGYDTLGLDHFEQAFETSQNSVGIIERFTIKGTTMLLIIGLGDQAGSSPRKLVIIDVNM